MAIDFPASPVTGQIFVAAGSAWRFNGTKWVANTTGSMTVVISDVAPVNPPSGLLWFNSTTGVMYLRYPDVDGAQWVVAYPGVAGPPGPQGQWTQVTQAQYNALSPPNPSILYVIVG